MTRNIHSNLWKLYAIRAISGCLFAIGIIVMLFHTAGLSQFEIYLVQITFAMTIVALEIPSGYLSDRWGRKPTLIVAFGMQVLGWCLYALSDSFPDFLIAEALVGIGVSFFSGTFEAMTYDTLLELQEEAAYRHVSRRQYALDLGFEAGSAIVGGVVALWNLHAALWLTAGAFAVCMILCWTLTEPQRHKTQETRHWKVLWDVTTHTLARHRGLRSITLISGMIGSLSLILFWLTQTYQEAIALPLGLWGVVHAIIVAAGALAAWHSGWFERRFDDRRMLTGIALTITAIYLALSFLPMHAACLSLFLLSRVAWCLTGPLTSDMINRMTTSDIRATVLSVSSFGGRIIFSIASPLVGLAVDEHGLGSAFLLTGIAGGLLLLAAFVALRTVWSTLPR